MESSFDTATHLQHQGELFSLVLTKEQAKYLKNLLPLNYSLHLVSTKRVKKVVKQVEKVIKRINLNVTNADKQLQMRSEQNNDTREVTLLRVNQPEKRDRTKSVEEDDEETFLPLANRRGRKSKQNKDISWIADFIKDLYSFSPIKQVFEQFFDQLKEKLITKCITQQEFKNAVEKMLVEDVSKKQINGEVVEKAKKIFNKHLKSAFNNIKSIEKTTSLVKLTKGSKESKKSPEKKSKTAEKKRKQLTIHKKSGSQTSSDSRFDFDLNEVHVKPATTLEAANSHFLDAGYVSRNLRKIPNAEALHLLKRYGVKALDILKIKALSKASMKCIKEEVKALKVKYTDMTDSSEDKQQYVESSIEIEDV